jgi:hypothetical protein
MWALINLLNVERMGRGDAVTSIIGIIGHGQAGFG